MFKSFTFTPSVLEMNRIVFRDNAESKFISYLPVNKFRFLDIYLRSKGFPSIEYVVAFRFDVNQDQPIHIDGDTEFRKCSLNFLISGEGKVQFHRCDEAPSEKISTTGIKSYSLAAANCHLISDQKMSDAFLMQTDIPHKAIQNGKIDLLCVRFKSNPSFQQVNDALKLE